MRTAAFDYTLPPDCIAQQPAMERDRARMMVVNRADGTFTHARVRDLPDFLKAPDLLVLNDTRVIPARINGVKEGTGGQVELLLLEEVAPHEWEVLMRSGRPPRIGSRLFFAGGRLQAVVLAQGERGKARVRLECDKPVLEILEEIGAPPLPPYIQRKSPSAELTAVDRDRYQTIYARQPGAVAAPTAGLHFTSELLDRLGAQGVRHTAVTLHVGAGTFRPVTTEEIEAHTIDSERYHVPAQTARLYNKTRRTGGRVVAVGSTSVRTLETAWRDKGSLEACSGRSDLYIYPPFEFQAVDIVMTNFHLPKSTLLMMVCAFGGYDLIMEAYRVAVQERYRFYSYGDCMLIL